MSEARITRCTFQPDTGCAYPQAILSHLPDREVFEEAFSHLSRVFCVAPDAPLNLGDASYGEISRGEGRLLLQLESATGVRLSPHPDARMENESLELFELAVSELTALRQAAR